VRRLAAQRRPYWVSSIPATRDTTGGRGRACSTNAMLSCCRAFAERQRLVFFAACPFVGTSADGAASLAGGF